MPDDSCHDEGGGGMTDDAESCICCNGTGWHESECGGRHHCLNCDGTGEVRRTTDA